MQMLQYDISGPPAIGSQDNSTTNADLCSMIAWPVTQYSFPFPLSQRTEVTLVTEYVPY